MDTEKVKTTIENEVKAVTQYIDGVNIVNIIDQVSYDQVVDITKEIKLKIKQLEDKRKSITKPIDESKKIVMELFRVPIEKLQAFELGLKKTVTIYLQKKEQERIEEQRKRDEEARKERERFESEARAKREKEEAARRAEEDARRKAEQSKSEEERKKFMAEAERKRKEADKANIEAESKEVISSSIVSTKVEPLVSKSGAYTVTTFNVKLKSKSDFIKHCVEQNRLEYLDINMSLLNKEAQATKGERLWPGVEVEKLVGTRIR